MADAAWGLQGDGRAHVSSRRKEGGKKGPGYDRTGRRLLTREEEIQLTKQFQDEGDIEARNTLVVSNSGLVWQFARREANKYDFVEVDDLVQEGFFGLMRACEMFDPERGFRFSTYSSYWIKAKISRRILQLSKEYSLPIPGALMQEDDDGRRQRPRTRTISIEEEIQNDDGETTSLSDVISGSFISQEDAAIDSQRSMRVRSALNRIFSETDDPRVRVIVTERLLTEDPCTLDELGYLCGVSREGARLIEKRVIRRLKKILNY